MIHSHPLLELPDQKTVGGLSVLGRGFPCLHLHYFTLTSAADFLLISPVEFLRTPLQRRYRCMFVVAHVRHCEQCLNAASMTSFVWLTLSAQIKKKKKNLYTKEH